ncbi:PepSY-like domain-containing protein [Candidatus Sumerlaeota bacterium]|nr:PepSY-like domain-containing protein [Candidatus Sumerlaeota bacterium]
MHYSSVFKTSLAFVVVAMFSLSARAAETKAKGPSLDQLPAAVQETVKKNLGEGEIVAIKQEMEDGQLQYEVEMTVEGKMVELSMDAQGNVVESETEVDLEDAPAEVQEAVKKSAGEARIVRVMKEVKGEAICYAAKIKQGEKTTEFKYDAKGKKIEEDDDEDEDHGGNGKADDDDDEEDGEEDDD